MTTNLTDELARLNELDSWDDSPFDKDIFDCVALANKLHSLLVRAEAALGEAIMSHDNLYMAHFNDAYGCEHDLAIIPARVTLKAIRDAKIGAKQ